MNKTSIKNFAITARIKLMEAIEQKAYELGITKKEIKKPEVYKDGFRVNDKFFKKYQMKQRDKLLQKINDQGFEGVIEEVAYTWFNRLIAIRFMEVNEYLPTGVRVLSSMNREKIEPDAVSDVLSIADELELELEVVYRLQDENNSEELFKFIFVKQCNKLGEIMPMMFEQIEDYTELLLPNKLLTEGSVVRDLVTMISEEDWKEQVEIIGWLYQYYISEKKDQVFADLKNNKKITKENIPAATQLFTPKWIVQYMVENSLGRLWLDSHPNEELQREWIYYLEEAEQEPSVQKQLDMLKNKELSPEDIKVFDPCVGSGHILVYAFDVLYRMYINTGYSERDIPTFILEKNLYGLDIDHRAAQLAYFALMMKARSYNRRIFRKKIALNLYSIQESNGIPSEAIEYFIKFNDAENNKEDIEYLVHIFQDAKDFGSILDVEPLHFEAIEHSLEQLRNNDVEDLFGQQYKDLLLETMPNLIHQAKVMSQKYDVVITNPPYMGYNGMNNKMKKYLETHFKQSKQDLYAVFIEKCLDYSRENKYVSMVTMHTWMFLNSFEGLRSDLINHKGITSILHLGMEAFENIIGKVVQTVAFVVLNSHIPQIRPYSVRLVDYYDSRRHEKEKQFFNRHHHFSTVKQSDFKNIPGSPVAYWIDESVHTAFENKSLGEISSVGIGSSTGNTDLFIKFWYEVNFSKINFSARKLEDSDNTIFKWYPYNKGGPFRKWYGNNHYVINWSENGKEIRNYPKSFVKNVRFYFKPGITWTRISTNKPSFRIQLSGYIFSDASPYTDCDDYYVLGFLNSNISHYLLSILNPTLNFQVGNISSLPIKYSSDDQIMDTVRKLTEECVRLSIEDWDHFELSWDFRKHPFLLNNIKDKNLSNTFDVWEKVTNTRFQRMKELEQQLNSLFLDIYELQDVISNEIVEKDITLYLPKKELDVRTFISYAIGCMFGRYTIEEDGIVFAGGEFNTSKYRKFKIAPDNIIPITDDEYFEDDLVSRFIDFLRITFGNESLEENLDFIANALTKKANETSRQRLRRYFVKEFYKDHLQTYQKRPIYWMFDSGKNDGFNALIYIHRYDHSTVAKIRTDYLHTIQRKYEAEVSRFDLLLESDVSAQEKNKAKKQKEKLQMQILECQQYDQVIAHVANQKVEIDLDDGMKINYEKFQNIDVPLGEGKKSLKANLLVKM